MSESGPEGTADGRSEDAESGESELHLLQEADADAFLGSGTGGESLTFDLQDNRPDTFEKGNETTETETKEQPSPAPEGEQE